MPEICRLYGIIIQMFYNDPPPPHFHITYGGHRATISIDNLKLLSGDFPRRRLNLVLDWAELHREELRQEWELARNQQPLFKIAP